MTRTMKISTSVFVAAVVVLIFGYQQLKTKVTAERLAKYHSPPISVTTVKAKETVWTTELDAVGTVIASQGVEVTPQVSGQVANINFKSGEKVNKGDLLIQLDDSLEQSNLSSSKAAVTLAALNYERQRELRKTRNTSQEDLDRATAKLAQDQATLESIQTTIKYMAIKAPFDGVAGIREVNVGDYLTPGQPIVSLQNLDKLFVDFTTPATNIGLLKVGLKVLINSAAYPDVHFVSTIVAIDSNADTSSRNITVRTLLDNQNGDFVPGMYVNVKVLTEAKTNLVPLPNVAITYTLYGDSVFVLTATDKKTDDGKFTLYSAKRKTVKVAMFQGKEAGVIGGIKDGDIIVTSNQQQLKDGATVIVNNKVVETKVTGEQ